MTIDELRLLDAANPYLREFKDKTFVIKLSGELCEPGDELDHIIEQLGFLYEAGIRFVVVHGGGKQATALAQRLGVNSVFVNGKRVTSEAMIEVTEMAFAGKINTDFLALFRKHGLPGVGLSGIDGGLVVAEKNPPTEVKDMSTGEVRVVDYGFVGKIKDVCPGLLISLLNQRFIPVLCSLAANNHGQILNINADELAGRIAAALNADKLLMLATVDGVLRNINEPQSLISEIGLGEVSELMNSGIITGGMLPKLATCIQALESGVHKVHIINGRKKNSLLREIFTSEGAGTLLY